MSYIITEAQAKELLKIAEGIVGRRVKKGIIPPSDRKDYIQELMLLMVQHQDDWNIPPGVRFEAFAATVMKKRVVSIWRHCHRIMDPLRDAESLDVDFVMEGTKKTDQFINLVTTDGDFFFATRVRPNKSRRLLVQRIRSFVSMLPEDERRLCELLMEHRLAEATRILKKSRWTIWRMTKSIRKKMQAAGFGLPPRSAARF